MIQVTDLILLEAAPSREPSPHAGRDEAHRAGGQGPRGLHTHRHTRAQVYAHVRAALDRILHPALGGFDDGEVRRGSLCPFLVKPGLQVQHLAQPEPPRKLDCALAAWAQVKFWGSLELCACPTPG